MKRKKLIMFIVIILCVTAIIATIYCVDFTNNKLSVEENNSNQLSENEKKIQELAEHLEDNSTNNVIIKINDTTGNEIEITQTYIDTIRMIEDTKEPEKQAIEYTIYATEARSMGIQLSDEDIEEIKELSNSEEILKYANSKKDKDILKKEIETYLTNISYKSELESKILDEIKNNELSIDNENLQQKMTEYMTIQNQFKENKKPSEEERKKCLEDLATKYFEIKDLYIRLIKEKYDVNNL